MAGLIRAARPTRRLGLRQIPRRPKPADEGRDEKDRITYSSLWVHAKRHYDLAGTTAYWRARMHKELMKALGG